MYFDEEDKVKVAGGFMLQVLPGYEKKSLVTKKKRIQEMPAISMLLESSMIHIEASLNAIYGDEPFKRLSEEELSFWSDYHVNALKMPSDASGMMNFKLLKMKINGKLKSSANSAKTSMNFRSWLGGTHQWLNLIRPSWLEM